MQDERDVGITIRIPLSDRNALNEYARENDQTVAQLIRRWIRENVNGEREVEGSARGRGRSVSHVS